MLTAHTGQNTLYPLTEPLETPGNTQLGSPKDTSSRAPETTTTTETTITSESTIVGSDQVKKKSNRNVGSTATESTTTTVEPITFKAKKFEIIP